MRDLRAVEALAIGMVGGARGPGDRSGTTQHRLAPEARREPAAWRRRAIDPAECRDCEPLGRKQRRFDGRRAAGAGDAHPIFEFAQLMRRPATRSRRLHG